jgi:hypothetical protein
MNIIEEIEQLRLLKSNNVELIIPIWSSPKGHELGFPISFAYIRTTESDYIINFTHIDANKVQPFPLGKLANENTLVLGNRYINSIGIDFEWVYFEEYGKPFIFNEFVESLYKWYRNDFTELNECIPLMKWYELLKTIPIIRNRKSWYKKYSDSITQLGRLEGAGVAVDVEKFIDRFNFQRRYMSLLSEPQETALVSTKYNPYTVTGRPSNHHLNVNWSALNKSDGTRNLIRSRFVGGKLVMFDYEAYHLRIISALIGYKLPLGESVHQHLADLYGVDYETGKGITFKYLYGGLDETARTIPFFAKVESYIRELYVKVMGEGVLTTPILKREIPLDRIDKPNEQKIFNYLLQALETEINYTKMPAMLDWFVGKESKLVLYTYDAYLIDCHPNEIQSVVDELPKLMERGGFPVKGYSGDTYGDLTSFNII